ncbi:MAG TPA: hypothetical protein VHY08_07190 [Bacillota bacterium]|nr:hypothetical protein [Bacillota bacterium]
MTGKREEARAITEKSSKPQGPDSVAYSQKRVSTDNGPLIAQMLLMQQTYGNRAIQRLITSGMIQTSQITSELGLSMGRMGSAITKKPGVTLSGIIQRASIKDKCKTGPISGQGGLANPAMKRLTIIIDANDTLRSIAKKILPLWNTAKPFTPEGATTPRPLTKLTEDQLAKGLLVYHQYYLGVPALSKWRTGLVFPLPIEVDYTTGERTLNGELVSIWADNFNPVWTPLLTKKAEAGKIPTAAELAATVQSLMETNPDPASLGARLAYMAVSNAVETEPLFKVIFQGSAQKVELALAFMDQLVNPQFEVLASQRPGLAIIGLIRDALSGAGLPPGSPQQGRLDRATRMMSRLGYFSPEQAETVEQIYIRDVPGAHCMGAVYKGLGGLFSPGVSRSVNAQVDREAAAVMRRTGVNTDHMNRIMSTLQARGKAGPPVEFRYVRRLDGWDPDPEQTILRMIDPSIAGWYFFGFSLHAAYHSVILAVDNTDTSSPKIFWMDQYSRGFVNDVTGTLQDTMKNYTPAYGYAPTKLWQIMPAADTIIELR